MRIATPRFFIYSGSHAQGGYMVNVAWGKRKDAVAWRPYRRYFYLRFLRDQ
jgi:hypothetical protein